MICSALRNEHGRMHWLAAWLVLPLAIAGCTSADDPYPNRPILLICPWAQGGGTDRVSRMLAAHLEQDLQVPVNVVNATGGKGVTGHSRGLRAKPDGYTLTMATLELNTMHWMDLTSLTVEDCIPLMSLNEDYAALIVRQDAPWQTVKELEAAIADNPGTLKASGTTTGGAWHLALAGWLIETGLGAESVTWISSTGSAPSLQELISSGVDMVCCSLPEADTFLAADQVRALGVMAPQRATGYDQVPTFAEQGTEWSLGGWRAVAVPLGTPKPIQARLLEALERVMAGETKVGGTDSEEPMTFGQFMERAQFDNTVRTGRPLREFLRETDRKLGTLLQNEAMKSVRQDPYSPYVFPGIVGGLMAVVLVALGIVSVRASRRQADSEHQPPRSAVADRMSEAAPAGTDAETESPPANWLALAAVIAAIVAYWLLAETVGFVLISAAILLGLMLLMRAPWGWTLIITVVAPVLIYQLFANVLRVPLPQGWLGW